MTRARPPATLEQSGPEVVLYHADCLDGFGAAWAVWKRFPSARYLAVKHGYPPPDDLAGRRVLIVDFSYPRAQMEQLAGITADLLLLDHHITAQKTLHDLPFARFEEHKSGAVMAWEWAHREPVPWLLHHIQDKDLWTWCLPHSREINAALASYPYEFPVWDTLAKEVLVAEGTAILRYERELAGKLAASAVLVTFQGQTLPAVQSAILTSQIGECLSARHPVCMIWHDRDGRRVYSLRSREDGPDVGAMAAQFGGGGHTHAAGFSVPLPPDSPEPLDPILKWTR